VILDGGHYSPYLDRFPDASKAAAGWFQAHLRDGPGSVSLPALRRQAGNALRPGKPAAEEQPAERVRNE
jgi:hypothetical protein